MVLSSPQLARVFPSGLTLSDWTAPRCPFCTLRHSPRCTSHQRSIPSLPPLSSSAPGGQALPTLRIPDDELPSASAPAPTGQPRPILTPCHARHHATMPLQLREQRAVGGLPQQDAAIIAATGQPGAVRTPRHTTDPAWLRTVHPAAGAGGHLPHLHSLLIARTGQKLSIRTPRHAIEGGVDVLGVPQELPSLARGCVRHPDHIVPPTTGKQLTIRTPRHPIHDPALPA